MDAIDLRVDSVQASANVETSTYSAWWAYFTATISRIISGSKQLIKKGTGTLILTGTNTYSGTTTISSGTLQIGNGGTTGSIPSTNTIENNGTLTFNRSDTYGVNNVITGTGSVIHTGSGAIALNGNNTFSGGVYVKSTGVLNLGNSNAAGSDTIYLQSTQSGGVTTLGIAAGSTINNPITIDMSTGREGIASYGTGNVTLNSNILITGNYSGGNTILFSSPAGSYSGTLTANGNISTATPAFSGTFSLRGSATGAPAGTYNQLNSTVSLPSAVIDINGSMNWLLNGSINVYGITENGTGSFILGKSNVFSSPVYYNATNTTSTLGGVDLNGYSQSFAGLNSTAPTTGNGSYITNNGTSNSLITLTGLAATRTFNGTIKDGATNNISLVMDSSGRTQILARVPVAYSGSTSILNGTLTVQKIVSGPSGYVSQASYTNTTLTVTFSTPPTVGQTFQILLGSTVQTYSSVTFVNGGGRVGSYDSTTSTLTITA